ncbi:MAG: NACHT domain-containing NTPase [Oscillatoria princeps RMCB-10]|nr:NACHT domain-containing NTPase [Oscillatoria princeps RMCB-10]
MVRLSASGEKRVDKARREQGWDRYEKPWAEKALTSVATLKRFWRKEKIGRDYFESICEAVGVNWEEVAEPREMGESQIDALVRQVRERVRGDIQYRCGTMKVLDRDFSIEVNDIYTRVYILQGISASKHIDFSKMQESVNPETFDRIGLSPRLDERRIPVIEAVESYDKLMVWGKPGSGKTTFLKYLAIQCSEGEFESDLVPIFVTLEDFAAADGQIGLQTYIQQQYNRVKETEVTELLKNGKVLVLLDGLDQVTEARSQRVLQQIKEFSDKFRDSKFVITCRIAAQDYRFEGFGDVEVADFDKEQIDQFAHKWFNPDTNKADRFVRQLNEPENEPVKELATNPLLLTLLCLVFEESDSFPLRRSDLYEKGIDLLLKKWNVRRSLEREHVYQQLSLQQKEDLLSQIASTTFELGNYFFRQQDLKWYITDWIGELPEAQTDPQLLTLDSEAVLKSIEAQHGLLVERANRIYSFSHLTFQEYFTARKIVTCSAPEEFELAFQNLLSHITDRHWREVFLLTVQMLRKPDNLLRRMKQKADRIMEKDEKLQELLVWLREKQRSVSVKYKDACVRAAYLEKIMNNYARAICAEEGTLEYDISLDWALIGALGVAAVRDPYLDAECASGAETSLERNIDSQYNNDSPPLLDYSKARDRYELHLLAGIRSSRDGILYRAIEKAGNPEKVNPELKNALEELKTKLPNPVDNEAWWESETGKDWTEQLRDVMIRYRNIGYDWHRHFSCEQRSKLKHYYNANRLLVDCLNSDCNVSPAVRQEIEDTLLIAGCGN